MPEFDYNAALEEPEPHGVWAGVAIRKVFWMCAGSHGVVPVATVLELAGTWAVMSMHIAHPAPEDVMAQVRDMIQQPRRPDYRDWERDLVAFWSRHREYFTYEPEHMAAPYRPQ